jgi:hypothetical protein
MLVSMCLSIGFIPLDIISVTGALRSAMPLGINPFWKVWTLSFSAGIILISLISSADGYVSFSFVLCSNACAIP